MIHRAAPDFWACYKNLPVEVQRLADRAFALLRDDPRRPSLHFKKIDEIWSVRIGLHYRAVGLNLPDGVLWFWIGTHADYDRIVA